MTGVACASTVAHVPTPRRRAGRLWPILLGSTVHLICLGLVAVGWWYGKPLTPELLAALVAFVGFASRTDGAMWRRLRGHDDALAAIAAHRGISPERVASMYDLVEEEVARTEAQARRSPSRKRT